MCVSASLKDYNLNGNQVLANSAKLMNSACHSLSQLRPILFNLFKFLLSLSEQESGVDDGEGTAWLKANYPEEFAASILDR